MFCSCKNTCTAGEFCFQLFMLAVNEYGRFLKDARLQHIFDMQQNPHLRFIWEMNFSFFKSRKILNVGCVRIKQNYYCGYNKH